jgi:hypothetical protein
MTLLSLKWQQQRLKVRLEVIKHLRTVFIFFYLNEDCKDPAHEFICQMYIKMSCISIALVNDNVSYKM